MMGTEMKTPENSENLLRNRKKKVKSVEKSSENEVNDENDDKKDKKKIVNETNLNFKVIEKSENFVFRLEFDPMSIALLAIALATRFFRLSEPRNVV
jgi:hypothetical protein